MGLSSPPRMFIRVDLPLPLTPTIAISSPGTHGQIQPLQSDDFQIGNLIDFDETVTQNKWFRHFVSFWCFSFQ